ncbi:hypothetical protein ACHAWF_013097 [Thalassiosira exigua]
MAEQCLRELIEEKRAGNVAADRILTADSYRSVIKAWIGARGYADLRHAEGLLDLMEEVHGLAGTDSARDDESLRKSFSKCHAAVLDGWCASRFPDAASRAEAILRRMGVRADVRRYNRVMNRIASGGTKDAGKEAERLLDEMIASYKERSTGEADGDLPAPILAPDRNGFNTVLKAYANSHGKDASSHALRVLSVMEDPSSAGLEGIAASIRPDRVSYTSALMSTRDGEEAERMLTRMAEAFERTGDPDVLPDAVTYNAVLKVWGKSGHPDAGERSEAILEQMMQLHEAGDSSVIPDDVTFNTVIHNIANSNPKDAPQRALELLERMEKYHAAGLIKARPDIITHNSVLNAFAKSGGSRGAWRAGKMLNSLERSYDAGASFVRPDVISYNVVISAWANSGETDRAVSLLDRMNARTRDGLADLRPSAATYNSVLHAWSRSSDRNAPVKALGLLEIMIRLREVGGDADADYPDVTSVTAVIDAFAKSRYPRKAKRTRDLLRRMIDMGRRRRGGGGGGDASRGGDLRPNVYAYAAVLNACAYAYGSREEREEALCVGIKTYEELQSCPHIDANHVAYGSYMRLCRRLIPEEDPQREDLMAQAFHQCCSDGQLGEYVLRQLRAVPALYKSLLGEYLKDGCDEVSCRDLPPSWTGNVKDRRRQATRHPSAGRKR